jgi:hypothetical protein
MPATSWSMLFQGGRAAHTLLLILSLSVSATNVWIVATVLPSVVADIGGAEFYAWPTALYTVASILGTASGRCIKATLGLRHGFMAGVSPSTVTAAATWVYRLSGIAPATIGVLTLRVLWFHKPVWPPLGATPLGAK